MWTRNNSLYHINYHHAKFVGIFQEFDRLQLRGKLRVEKFTGSHFISTLDFQLPKHVGQSTRSHHWYHIKVSVNQTKSIFQCGDIWSNRLLFENTALFLVGNWRREANQIILHIRAKDIACSIISLYERRIGGCSWQRIDFRGALLLFAHSIMGRWHRERDSGRELERDFQ